MLAIESSHCLPRLVVIVPTHNRWQEARLALASLAQSEYRNCEFVLVEDGCVDGTVESCMEEFPDVHLLHGDGTLWWSGAINKGVEYALSRNADAVVWMNDDNRVEPQTITRMVESFLRNGERSVICARTKSIGAGSDEWVGDPPRWRPEFGKWTPPDLSALDAPLEHPPGGRGVLIPAQCFREVGFVDQRSFPHYWADHDFHYRAMKAGYKYFLATEAVIWNVPNAERKDSPARFSFGWARQFLFSRRSPMNMLALRRLLKRHLPPEEYRATFYPLLWRTLTWLASGWAARNKIIHRSLRAIKRGFAVDR
jgi:GT2 family glycosyltransferase